MFLAIYFFEDINYIKFFALLFLEYFYIYCFWQL
jgi:hypothetical protein